MRDGPRLRCDVEIFRYKNGVLPNSLALGYVAPGYLLALWGLANASGLVWLLACLLLSHVLVIAAYLLHECIHNTIFKNSHHNEWLGKILAWLTGAAYTPYPVLQKKHLRHHADRVDVLAIDYREFLQSRPVLLKFLTALQLFHLPTAEFISHYLALSAPFLLESRRQYRSYVLLVLGSRALFFVLLAWINWAMLAGHLLAWIVLITVLGFMDAFQHQYEVRLQLDDNKILREFDRDYEEAHTFSNLLSGNYRLFNLLVLNFCYHNVHHFKSGVPWYDLPAMHEQRYQDKPAPVITLSKQLQNFHQHRIARLQGTPNVGKDTGAAGVSFLVGV